MNPIETIALPFNGETYMLLFDGPANRVTIVGRVAGQDAGIDAAVLKEIDALHVVSPQDAIEKVGYLLTKRISPKL